MEAVVKHKTPPRSIEWKGVTYLPGQSIPDLTKKEAERLFRLGLIEAPKVVDKEPEGKGGKDKGKDTGAGGDKGGGNDGKDGGGGSE